MSSSVRARAARAVLVSVQTPGDRDPERSLEELVQLVRGLGIVVDATLIQKRPNRTAPSYLGEGKLDELVRLAAGGALVVVDDDLTPGQLRNLQVALGDGVELLDRTAVILRVFEARARTRVARLEVELARLEYELPRIRDDHTLGDREGGGGRAARGHTNVELAKMRARDRIAAVRRELGQLARTAERTRAARAETFRVALVGYTNAGKSSVMRLLTGSDVVVEDRLFATLGTTVRPLAPPARPPILAADTVGFLDRLPHALVASFRSTLEEAHEAWLLLHVADAADPAVHRQIEVTARVLAELGAAARPTWLLLNKIDRVDAAARAALRAAYPEALQLSALDRGDGAVLRERLESFFDEQLVEARLTIPYAKIGAFAELRDQLRVVDEQHGEALDVVVRGTAEVLGRLQKRVRT